MAQGAHKARAAEAGEPAGYDAAAEKRAQLALDEARQPFAAAAHAHLGEKGLEVLADHALEDAVPGMAADARVPPAAG